ncbi:unnamed protein product [Acanthoscelides obtectus]|uniref:Hexosyltransferase n=1 Tax=Acanthoscelides obtectus TaxID=200917 RepID=A0A9P0M3I5_ACAOB|nr:unnamed protein product [Acanthoscelides obtectus]CAK1629972.1 Beta-1,3-galactosyltransferase 6 [Acanthoscelides obtectus]
MTEEQTTNKDLLILPVLDNYKNLTLKIKHTFQWLSDQYDHGMDFKYVLKCDGDSFVHLKSLVVQANNKEGPNKLNLYWGYFYGNARIFTKGKWKETDWIFSDRYLPYALGGGYLLSKNLVTYIGKNAENLRTFNAEDVSVGFWLAPVDNILRIHDTRFDTEWKSRGCQNQHLIVHHVSSEEMLQYYKNVEEFGQLCPVEVKAKRRSVYIYNWKVSPSQCCKRIEESAISLSIKPVNY